MEKKQQNKKNSLSVVSRKQQYACLSYCLFS